VPAELSDDPYAILGVPRTASAAEVKEAYRKLAKATHPDIDARPEAMAAMVRINSAYELLADPYRRSRWDATHPVDGKRPRGSPAAAPRPGATPPRGASGAGGSAGGSGTGPGSGSARPGSRSGTGSRPSEAPGRGSAPPQPSLDEAFAFRFGTGKYQGRTIGEVVEWDRGYVEWVARTGRDRPRLAMSARKVLMHLDGIEREAGRGPAMGTAPGAGTMPGSRAGSGAGMGTGSGARSGRRLTRDRAIVLVAASLAAIAAFVLAWLLIVLLGS
jgi:curved DNA-binding protein CbpA